MEAEWLKECMVCNVALCTEFKRLIEEEKLSPRKAAKVMVKQQEEQLGVAVYSAEALRQRYLYHTNKVNRNREVVENQLEQDGDKVVENQPDEDEEEELVENQPEQPRNVSLWERKEELGGEYANSGPEWREGEELPPEYQELDRIRKALGFKTLFTFVGKLRGTVWTTQVYMRCIYGKGKVQDEEFREWFEHNKAQRGEDGSCWLCLYRKPNSKKTGLCKRCVGVTERDKENFAIQDRGVDEEATKVWTDIYNDSHSLIERIAKALADESPPKIPPELAENTKNAFKEIGEHRYGDVQKVALQDCLE